MEWSRIILSCKGVTVFFHIEQPTEAFYSSDTTMIDLASTFHDLLGRSDARTGHAAAELASVLPPGICFRSVGMAPFFEYDGEDFAEVLNLVPLNAAAEIRAPAGRQALRTRVETWRKEADFSPEAQAMMAGMKALPQRRLVQAVSALVDFTKRCAVADSERMAQAWPGLARRHLDERLLEWLDGHAVDLRCTMFDSREAARAGVEVVFTIGQPPSPQA